MEDLRKLCSINAVSGNEYSISKYIKNYIAEFCDKSYIDEIGNVIGYIDNKSNINILLEAQIDQIGLVVKEINKNGFIKFINCGGIDLKILPAAEVTVHGKKDVFGVIGSTPPHLQNAKSGNISDKIDNYYIDCGYSYKDISKIVSVGDTISFNSEFKNMQNGFITSKSLDNRIGVYVLTECIKQLYKRKSKYNLTALFSSQEEIGSAGAIRSISKIKPDIAVVVDVTFGVSPDTSRENGFNLSEGITVAAGPSLDLELNEKFMNHCKSKNIPFAKEVCPDNTGTNAWYIQDFGRGTRCILVSIPIRYMHSFVEVANESDIKFAVDAIVSALKEGVFDA